MKSLSTTQIARVVNHYIGVFGGYLGDFSYGSFADFIQADCELDINPLDLPGTTRSRFIAILSKSSADIQARILKRVIERFPPYNTITDDTLPKTRTFALKDELLSWIESLEKASPVKAPTLRVTSEVAKKALADAEALIEARGADSALDRMHTAMHGYLRTLCEEAGLTYTRNDTTASLFKTLRSKHPKLIYSGPRAKDVDQILHSCSIILGSFNPIRNNASMAHPNTDLVLPEEAC